MSPTIRQALVRHAAPVLLYSKPAALFTLPCRMQELSLLTAALARQGLRTKRMRRHRDRVLLLVYRPAHLAQALADPLAVRLLRGYGYAAGATLDESLRTLRQRIATQQNFPHEVGLFLGYPPADVAGFIHHGGSHYKLCGQWKVYSDVARAQSLFSEYERCSQLVQRHLNSGGDLTNLTAITGGHAAAGIPNILEVANG